MKFPNNKTRRARLNALVAALGASLLIVACGGGGGGGSGSGGVPIAPQAWQVAQLLEATDNQAGDVDVSINANGTGYAVWQQLNGGERDIFSSVYRDGAWQPAKPVTEANADAFDPQVAVLPDGEALAIWRQKIPLQGTDGVFFNKTVGGLWQGAQFLQNEEGDVNENSLQLLADAQGNAMAVWSRKVVPATNPASSRIFASAYRSNAFEQVAQQVNFGTNDATNPDIAIDAQGNVLAVWDQLTAPNNVYRIFARPNSEGFWKDDFVISDPNENLNGRAPSLAAGANGSAIVAWHTAGGIINANVATNFMNKDWRGTGLGDTPVTGVNAGARVAIDLQGNATIVWQKTEGAVSNIYGKQIAPNGQSTLPKKIDVDDAGNAGSARVASDASGRSIVVWEQSNGARIDLMSSRLLPGSTEWLAPELIENENAGSAGFPALAVNSKGQAIAAWEQNVGFVNPILGSVMANVFK